MQYEESARRRVARGLSRLAPGCPRWWDSRNHPAVEVLLLDFTDPRHGLLAAVYGSHDIGLNLLGVRPDEAVSYGFEAEDEADNAELRRWWDIHASSSRAADATSNLPC